MPELLDAFLDWLGTYRSTLTAPGLQNLVVIVAGWIQTTGRHAITQTLVVTDVARRRHHEAFHRFFSRGTWHPDHLARWLFERLRSALHVDEHGLRVVLDDTLAAKKGQHVFGIGCHLDAVRSTRRFRVFCFGHCWVVLAVLVRVPFSRRPWALPLLFRLYRNKKECAAKRHAYRKKTELAREMLDVFHRWVGDARVEVAADAAYCNDTVTRGLTGSFVLFGAMRPDAVLTALPDERMAAKTGRRRRRGRDLPKPAAVAGNARKPWRTCEADLYGHKRTVHYKELCAQWYRACGVGLLRVVIVKVSTGALGCRVFFCTDATRSVREILEGYAGRWAVEVSHSCCSPCDRPIYVSVDAEKIAPSDVDDRGFSVDPVARARRHSEAAGGPSCVERAAGRRNTTRDALVEPTTSMSAPQTCRASSARLERSAGKTASATHAWALGARRAAERAPERRPRSPTDDGTRRAGGCGPSLDESKSRARWSASRAWRRDPEATTHSRAAKSSSGTSATRATAGDGACRSGSAPCWR
jgi:DDE superfamily endonuclease